MNSACIIAARASNPRKRNEHFYNQYNERYNIDLDMDSLKYTNQFCWEVESDVR